MKKFIKRFYSQIIAVILTLAFVFSVKVFNELNYTLLNLHFYIGWQEVNIHDDVTIKVPGNWKQGEKNGLIYFYDPTIETDSDDNIVFFEIDLDKDYDEIEVIQCHNPELDGGINSAGSKQGQCIIHADGMYSIERYVTLPGDVGYDFCSWNRVVDRKTSIKIADSAKIIRNYT